MNQASWPVITILLGVGLMLVAPLLISATPIGASWTDADYQQHQKASADLHAATTQLPDKQDRRGKNKSDAPPYDPVAAKEKYTAAKAAFDKQEARLQAVRSRPTWIAWGLRLAGVAITALGLYGYVTVRPLPPTLTTKPPPSLLTKPSPSPAERQPMPPGYNEVVTSDGPPPRISE